MGRTTGRCLAAGCMAVAAVAFAAGAVWAGMASQPSAIQKVAPAQGTLAPTTVTPAVAPATGDVIHLTIPGISGEGPGGKIVGHSFRRGQAAPRDAATGRASGKVHFNEFHITKTVDASSPRLMQAVTTGRHFDSVVIEFHRAQADAKGAEKTSKTKPVKSLTI